MPKTAKKIDTKGLITDKSAAMVVTKDTRIMDPGARGEGRLVLRIKPDGSRTFSFRYSHRGVQASINIGPFAANGAPGAYTVKMARAIAALMRAEQKQFPDMKGHRAQVAADKAKAEQAALEAAETKRQADAMRVTVRQLFEQWAAVDLATRVNSEGRRKGRVDGGKWVRASFERRVFPKLGNMFVEDVKKPQLVQLLHGAKSEGKLRTTNVLLADLQQMFKFAVLAGFIEHSPIAMLEKKQFGGDDTKRRRHLKAGEVHHLAVQLTRAAMAPRSVLAIWLILATTVRVSEAMSAEWRHIDLDARTWYLPTSKNQRDHLIHLSDFAMVQIEALLALRENITDKTGDATPCPWVFPDSKGTGPLDTKTLQKQIADRQRLGENRLNNRTKLVDILTMVGGRWTCHDLRRTATTFMSEMGISMDVANECLNHKLKGLDGNYNLDRRLPQQELAFNALGAKLATLTSGKALASNVRALKAKAA